MITETLKTIFNRDLKKLYTEIEMYNNEALLWKTEKNISNAAGNLCLHLIGNLNTYIGKVLGNTNYVRNRELEFSLKNIPASQLLAQIESTIEVVNNTLDKLSDEALQYEYPILVFETKTSTAYLLLHLATHLNYHLGQINYHRRLLHG
jgi:uncharacterized damage-inducible protein DinB